MIAATTGRELLESETRDPYLLAVRAYVWGYALVEATRNRQVFTSPDDPLAPRPPTSAGAPLNSIGHQRRLSDPTLEHGVAPNVDTLYSLAWLDLRDEAFVLETPDFGSRYYTFQMAYGDTASDVSLGMRTHGCRLPPVFIAGPDERRPAPPGTVAVRCHTRYFLIAGRILVRPDDLADHEAVYGLQSRIDVRPLSSYLVGSRGPNPVPEQRLLDEHADSVDSGLLPLQRVGNVLRDWIVLPQERPLVDSFRAIGLTPESGFQPGPLPSAVTREIARGLVDGAELVERKRHDLGQNVNGWTINYKGPRFADDYLLRSAVAKEQIYVTVAEEALYPVAVVDATGSPLTGEYAYRITFAAGAFPPVDAFWSITMYADHGPLVVNPIDRYAIGDRTAGLVIGSDGSLAVQVQNAPPSSTSRVNWLPAPKGHFRLMMRMYVPRPDALNGSWVPPPIERVSPA